MNEIPSKSCLHLSVIFIQVSPYDYVMYEFRNAQIYAFIFTIFFSFTVLPLHYNPRVGLFTVLIYQYFRRQLNVNNIFIYLKFHSTMTRNKAQQYRKNQTKFDTLITQRDQRFSNDKHGYFSSQSIECASWGQGLDAHYANKNTTAIFFVTICHC